MCVSCLFYFSSVLGTDYDFVGSSSVTFEPDDFTMMTPQCVSVSLLPDNAFEGDHSFQLFISSDLSELDISPGVNNITTITITDSAMNGEAYTIHYYIILQHNGFVYGVGIIIIIIFLQNFNIKVYTYVVCELIV